MRRFDGRLVIAGMLAVGLLFVGINLLAKGSSPTRVIASPSSDPAVPGRAYQVRLLSRCTPAVDFDGAFWAARRPGSRLRGPATARLLPSGGVALSVGRTAHMRLTRVRPPLRLAPCPSA